MGWIPVNHEYNLLRDGFYFSKERGSTNTESLRKHAIVQWSEIVVWFSGSVAVSTSPKELYA